MADIYTQFCIVLTKLTRDEFDWLEAQRDFGPKDIDEGAKVPPWYDATTKILRFDLHVFDEDGGSPRLAHIESEEGGDVEAACELLHEFLKRFRPKDFIEVEWAVTCSRILPGEFGGGAAFVTANDVTYMASSTWLAKQREAREAKPPVKPVHVYPLALVAKEPVEADVLARYVYQMDHVVPWSMRVVASGEGRVEPAEDYALDEEWFDE